MVGHQNKIVFKAKTRRNLNIVLVKQRRDNDGSLFQAPKLRRRADSKSDDKLDGVRPASGDRRTDVSRLDFRGVVGMVGAGGGFTSARAADWRSSILLRAEDGRAAGRSHGE